MYSVRWFSISRLNTVCRIFFEILLLTDWSIKFCISFGFNVKWMWVILICLLGNFVGYKYCTSRQSRWPILFTQLYGLYPSDVENNYGIDYLEDKLKQLGIEKKNLPKC